MRILIIGAGATGGYFGGRLAAAGRDVTFLVRPARAEQLRADGLRIVSPHGDVQLQPRLVSAGGIDGPFDVVLLAVKAYSLEGLLEDMAPAVGPDTMLLPLLNGMKHLDLLSGRFGREAVLGGLCRIVASLDEAGRVVQYAKLHDLAYGELDGADTPRIQRLDACLQGAGFAARWAPAIQREMWEKWVLLAALGGANCLMRSTVGEIAAAPGGGEFVLRLMDEIVSVVNTVGHPPSQAFLADARTMLTAQGSSLTSSMYRDLQNGGPIEADQIIGDLLARGRGAGVPAPLLAAVYTQLAAYQNRRAGC
jgi:2-dehydropantoate 2-reductase